MGIFDEILSESHRRHEEMDRERGGKYPVNYEGLMAEGWELRHLIRVGHRVVVVQASGLEPALPVMYLYYFDVTEIIDQVYRAPVGMGEYCMIKVWPKPSRIMLQIGQAAEVETFTKLRVYTEVELPEVGRVKPSPMYRYM